MNEKRAREILAEVIQSDGNLRASFQYIHWNVGESTVELDDNYTADELEAIAFWMRHTKK